MWIRRRSRIWSTLLETAVVMRLSLGLCLQKTDDLMALYKIHPCFGNRTPSDGSVPKHYLHRQMCVPQIQFFQGKALSRKKGQWRSISSVIMKGKSKRKKTSVRGGKSLPVKPVNNRDVVSRIAGKNNDVRFAAGLDKPIRRSAIAGRQNGFPSAADVLISDQ